MRQIEADSKLESLQKQWKAAVDHFERHPKDVERIADASTTVLTATCETVRQAFEAEKLPVESLLDLVNKASDLEDSIVDMVYTHPKGIHETIPPFCGRVVKDSIPSLANGMCILAREEILQNLPSWSRGGINTDVVLADLGLDESRYYNRSLAPSPEHTTKIAIFRRPVAPTPNDASDVARAIFEARLEATSQHSAVPIGLEVSGSTLIALGQDPFGRDSFISVYDCDALAANKKFYDSTRFPTCSPGLADGDTEMAVDAARELVFVADDHRIKCYSLTALQPENPKFPYQQRSMLPVHTLSSGTARPMAIIGSDLVRVGARSLSYWDLDRLPTHGTSGTDSIGGDLDLEYLETGREPHEVEISTGTRPHKTVELAESSQGYVEAWAHHPSQAAEMICAWDKDWSSSCAYSCVSLNIETGQHSGRWLGHGGKIYRIRSNHDDPRHFITSAGDGVSRLYDVRVPVPALAVRATDEHINDSLYVDIGGHPFIIHGGSRTQSVRVWDVRAEQCLYELATGNIDPMVMAWDAQHHTLFVSTECGYKGRAGGYLGYRKYKRPTWERGEDDEEDEYDDEGPCWPTKAHHDESSFGYAFDCGEHRILRYAFKDNADINVVPHYGDASIHRGYR